MFPALKMNSPYGSLLGKGLVILDPRFLNSNLLQPIPTKGFKKISPTIRKDAGENLKDTRKGSLLNFCHWGVLFLLSKAK
jgi:hypothetical protein